ALIALLRDPRETVRRAVVKALAEIEAPGVPDLLRAALLDESGLVRQQAVASLGRLQAPDTAAALLPLLEDVDPRMRFVTLRALGHLRNPEVVASVLPFLGDARKELRFAAVEALGDIRAPAAVRPLTAILTDSDRNLRRVAADSLGWIADARAAARLVEILGDPGVQSAAAEALRRMGLAALSELERGFAGAGAEARRLIVNLTGKLEDRRARRLLLSALADDSASVRAEAALALGDGGFLEAVRPLMDLKASDPSPVA